MRIAYSYVSVLAFLAAVMGGGGCSMVPEEEPIPAELAILFTGATGGELEPPWRGRVQLDDGAVFAPERIEGVGRAATGKCDDALQARVGRAAVRSRFGIAPLVRRDPVVAGDAAQHGGRRSGEGGRRGDQADREERHEHGDPVRLGDPHLLT